MPDAQKVLIRFNRGVSPYRGGETAAFDKSVADRLVSEGNAEYADAPAKKSEEKESVEDHDGPLKKKLKKKKKDLGDTTTVDK